MSFTRHTARALTAHPRISSIRPSNGRSSLLLLHGQPHAGRRNLHVGAAMGDAVQLTTDALTWMHSTAGVPWYITIPLLAVGVNFTIRLPLQFYVARLRERRNELTPLTTAWLLQHRADQMLAKNSQARVPDAAIKIMIAGSFERSRKRIYKAWGVQRWKGLAPLLGMVPFVTISEALRRKCGAPLGLVSHSMGLDNVEAVQANLGPATTMLDPSFVNGGLLWFTDLTSMDPYFGLPMLCTAILGYGTWGRMSKDHLRALLSLGPSDTTTIVPLTNLQKALGRLMLLVPVFPLLFADLPSAIFLYWASSFALTNVNEVILKRLVPPRTPRLKYEPRKSTVPPYLRE